MQCQKAISAPWYTRHLLLFNWRDVSSCHSAAKRTYLLTCKSSIYFLSADVTASFWLALTQWWLNGVPSSMTLSQHWTNIVSGYRVAGVPCKNETFSQCCFAAEPWSIYWFADAGLMSAQWCKRWATIRLTLCQWLAFADQLWPQPSKHEALTQCCSNAGPTSSTPAQH